MTGRYRNGTAAVASRYTRLPAAKQAAQGGRVLRRLGHNLLNSHDLRVAGFALPPRARMRYNPAHLT